MLSAKEAYVLLCKHDPRVKDETEIICDWGSFYSCSVGLDGDTEGYDWRIDKESKRIEWFDISQLIEELNKHDDEYEPKEILIKDLFKEEA